ncbi:MAG: IS200/IS605 family accessory protein TnpB-related protein [Xenococcaceae cyanobacterium MO_207.B15]|nr:IS200/IS605 family accessory protein TnpB-related protein [Xenococcaceae cyanobacterium MO_207.B15]
MYQLKAKVLLSVAKRFKSINQRYNKTIANYKTGKSNFYWDEYLDKITHKRNCQIKDSVNKAARFVINYCLNYGIGNIVFGWGQGVKTHSNLGKVNNQNFVQIPTAKLKNRIKELAESIGIVFTETEEAYTSKSDFLAGDLLFKFGEKPKEYKFSGRRITRGTYKSQFGLISADALGAVNILKKAIQRGLGLPLTSS